MKEFVEKDCGGYPGSQKKEMKLDRTLEHELNLRGHVFRGTSWSGVWTYVHAKSLGLLFDIGRCTPEMAKAGTLLLSHAHVDHSGDLMRYINFRELFGLTKPKIYLPKNMVSHALDLLGCWDRFEGRTRKRTFDLIGVEGGDTFDLTPKRFVKVYDVPHSQPSVGFQIFEKRKSLKAEYVGLAPEKIKALREKGEDISRIRELPIVSWIGDHTPEAMDKTPELFQSDIVFVEATHLAPDKLVNARNHGHTHIGDIRERAMLFKGVRYLVIKHFSKCYKTKEEVQGWMRRSLPTWLRDRTVLLGVDNQ